jgi:predicted esterase
MIALPDSPRATASTRDDPHALAEIVHDGVALDQARVAVLLCHGRSGDARHMLELARSLPREHVAVAVPQAAHASWYPNRFLAPIAQNEPWLTSALGVISRIVDTFRHAGLDPRSIVVGGFSQGGCLALEWALRSGTRLGGVFALSGAVIGEPGTARPHDREMSGTPVFIGCGDSDAHVPLSGVRESVRVLTAQGADVVERMYPGVGHRIVAPELRHVSAMIRAVLAGR